MCPQKTKWQVEVKILLLLCCYLFIWSDAIGVTVATLLEADEYRDTLFDYLTCQAPGTEDCSLRVFERFDVVSKTIASALIGLYPAIFLIYFVRVKRSTCRYPANNSVQSSLSAMSR